MSKETIEEEVNPWEYMSERWKQFAPPGRPSEKNIENYRQLLYDSFADKAKEQYNVLVLGATPEIRDMLAVDKKINVVLVDITFDMLIAMSELMESETEEEVWVKSNWITAPLPENYFDAVLSDLVICNIAKEKHDKFYRKILSLLKDTGHWINRVYYVDQNTSIRSLEDLLAEYSQKESITREDINNFRSTAGLIAWDKDRKILEWKKLYEEMKKYQIDGEFEHPNPKYVELLQGTYELFKPFNKKYYLDTKEGTEESIEAYFKIENKVFDESVTHLKEKAYCIYDLVKK